MNNPAGPVTLRTLADHRAFTLSAFCQTCDRSVVLNKDALADRYGWDVQLEDIRRRLKCQRCGRPADRLLLGHEQAATPGLKFDTSNLALATQRDGVSAEADRALALDVLSGLRYSLVMAILDAEFALLQALMFGDGYGLELMERVKDRTNGEVRIRLNRVYPVLRRLEGEGLLESYDGKPVAVTGGRPRVYYRLTPKGRKVARRQRASASGLLQPALGVG